MTHQFLQVASDSFLDGLPYTDIAEPFPGPTTTGSLIVVSTTYTDATGLIEVAGVTDTAGNVYKPIPVSIFNTPWSIRIWYCYNTKPFSQSNKVTVHYTAPVTFPKLRAHEYRSTTGKKFAVDPYLSAASGVGNSAAMATTSLLPPQDFCNVVGMGFAVAGNVIGATGTGMVIRAGGAGTSPSFDTIQTTAASTTSPVTVPSGQWTELVACFADASDPIGDAVSSSAPVWVPQQTKTDWRRSQLTGTLIAGAPSYGGEGSYDDLSDQETDAYTVSHSLDDGLPGDVTASSSADASGTLSQPLNGRYGLVFDHIDRASGVFNWDTTFANPSVLYNPGSEQGAAISDLVFLLWKGAAGPETLTSYPNELRQLIPPTDLGWGSGFRVAVFGLDRAARRLNPQQINNPKFTFTGPVAFEIASEQLEYLDSTGTRWLTGSIKDLKITLGGASTTSHTSPNLVVPDSVSGGIPGSFLIIDQVASAAAGANAFFWKSIVGGILGAWTLGQYKVNAVGTHVAKSAPGTYQTQATTSVATSNKAYITWEFIPDEFDQMDARQYFSPFNSGSPVSGFDRDLSPLTVDHGTLTEEGPMYSRVFTGQMSDIPLNGRQATLQGVSKTRIDMLKSVLPPLINGAAHGANLTWLVTWLLGECARYAAPEPSAFARFWASFHGSLWPNFATPVAGQPNPGVLFKGFNAGGGFASSPDWVTGPFVLGMYGWQGQHDAGEIQLNFRPVKGWTPNNPNRDQSIYSSNGYAPAFERSVASDRFTMWVRGDDFYGTPTEYTPTTVEPIEFLIQTKGSGVSVLASVSCGVIGTNRHLYVHIVDSSGHDTFWDSGITLPNNGLWHQCSWSWDFVNGDAWVSMDGATASKLDFVVDNTDLPSPGESFAPVYDGLSCRLISRLPVADAQLECFNSASQMNSTPLPPLLLPATASIVRPVPFDLAAILETAPRAAWDILVDLAHASLAAYRCDEQDRVNFLPLSYFGEQAQLEIIETIDTEVNADDIDVVRDPSRIRNSVTVQFTDTSVSSIAQYVLRYDTVTLIPSGSSALTLPLDSVQAQIFATLTVDNLSAAEVTAGHPTVGGQHWATVNTKSDGTGTYLDETKVKIAVTSSDSSSVTLSFLNLSGKVAYLANAGTDVPVLNIYGYPLTQGDGYVTKSDSYSIDRRGERTLSTSIPYVQQRVHASQLAMWMVAMLSQPTFTADTVAMGNPTRIPGQMVQVADSQGTGAQGTWRTLAITHNKAGGQYTHSLGLVRVDPVATWDVGNWDETVWGA